MDRPNLSPVVQDGAEVVDPGHDPVRRRQGVRPRGVPRLAGDVGDAVGGRVDAHAVVHLANVWLVLTVDEGIWRVFSRTVTNEHTYAPHARAWR